MNSKKQWTVEECCNLIELYREHPNLWNFSHLDYKNKMKRYDSLQEIAAHFQTTYDEVDRKLKNVNSQYLRERRHYKNIKKSGAGHLFKSKWFGYAAMSFLQNNNKPKKSREASWDYEDNDSGDSTTNASQTNYKMLINQQENEQLLEDPLEQFSPHQSSQPIESIQTENEHRTYLPPQPSHKVSKSKDSTNTNNKNLGDEAFLMMKSIFEKRETKQHQRDEYHIFGELVGHQLRSLKTSFAKATVQHMINNILYDAKLGRYDCPQSRGLKQTHLK